MSKRLVNKKAVDQQKQTQTQPSKLNKKRTKKQGNDVLVKKETEMEEKEEEENNEDEIDYKIQTVSSSVFASDKNESFDHSIWLYVSELGKIEKKLIKNHYPHGLSKHGELTLIGKTRSRLSSSNKITDQVGQAQKSTLKLQVCHMNKVYELDSFYALNFNKKDCFEWKLIDDNNNFSLLKYGLRLGVDTVNQSCIYAGRTLSNKYSPIIVGHVNNNLNLVVALNNKDTINLNQFELLCLKPSPAKLKHLCRNMIRSIMTHKNDNMEKLEYLIESSLIKYVKYKNCLKCGQELKKGECLVSKNGIYKLKIELDDRLLYYINDKGDYLCLYKNVDSLWFNDLGGLIVCFKDFKSTCFVNNFSHLNIMYDEDSKLRLNDNGNLQLVSSLHPKKIIIQFRDDIQLSINSLEPNFDYVFFFEKNLRHEMFRKNSDEFDSDSESEFEDDSSSSDDSSTTATTSDLSNLDSDSN